MTTVPSQKCDTACIRTVMHVMDACDAVGTPSPMAMAALKVILSLLSLYLDYEASNIHYDTAKIIPHSIFKIPGIENYTMAHTCVV